MPRVPYIMLTAMTALSLTSCASAQVPGSTRFPTQLPGTVTVDDKLGIAVETAYQAASLAERTVVKAGMVSPTDAQRLMELDTQAYTYVCYTRTAYDLANGKDPGSRVDACPVETKSGRVPAYADAARTAIVIIKELLGSLNAFHVSRLNPPPQPDGDEAPVPYSITIASNG